MTPNSRTPQQRDRRFARVRRITQTILIGSGAASGLFVGYAASIAKPLTVIPYSRTHAGGSNPSTVTPTSPSSDNATGSPTTPSTTYTPPSAAPVAAKTTCYSTPSGQTVCY